MPVNWEDARGKINPYFSDELQAQPSCKKTGRPFGRPAFLFSSYCLLASGRYDDHVGAHRHDNEVIAAVTLPAALIVLGANRALLTI